MSATCVIRILSLAIFIVGLSSTAMGQPPISDLHLRSIVSKKINNGVQGAFSDGSYPHVRGGVKFKVSSVADDALVLSTVPPVTITAFPSSGLLAGDSLDLTNYIFEVSNNGGSPSLQYVRKITESDLNRWRLEYQEYYLIDQEDEDLEALLDLYRADLLDYEKNALEQYLIGFLQNKKLSAIRKQPYRVLRVKAKDDSTVNRVTLEVQGDSGAFYDRNRGTSLYLFGMRTVGPSDVQVEEIDFTYRGQQIKGDTTGTFFRLGETYNHEKLPQLRWLTFVFHREIGYTEKSVEDLEEEKRLASFKFRGWTSDVGTTIEAKLVSQSEDKVVLLRKNNKKIVVDIKRLSDVDRRYLKRINEGVPK